MKATTELANSLYDALRSRQTIAPPRVTFEQLSVADAYSASEQLLAMRLADGETLVGRKIGLTSEAVQRQLNVGEPDFGSLTSAMQFANNAEISVGKHLIAPQIEGEIAFVLGADLRGAEVQVEDVIEATDYVVPCFEIVDSRVADWNIQLVDTVADNASSGLFVLGDGKADPKDVDLAACEMTIWRNEELACSGLGSAAMGSPANCVAWLAKCLAQFDIGLKAGDVILSGALAPFQPLTAGDRFSMRIDGLGTTQVSFVA